MDSNITHTESTYTTIMIGVIELIACAISGFLADKFGRRSVMIVSGVFMTFSLFGVILCMYQEFVHYI